MKVAIFLADGFEECEALIVVDILRRAGVETFLISIADKLEVESSRHIVVIADALAKDVEYTDLDLVVLPGGRLGTENLSKSALVKEQCQVFAKNKKVAAICAAPTILAKLGLLDGKNATCHPDFEKEMNKALLKHEHVVQDGNILTGQGLGASFEFAFELVRVLVGNERVQQIKKEICY